MSNYKQRLWLTSVFLAFGVLFLQSGIRRLLASEGGSVDNGFQILLGTFFVCVFIYSQIKIRALGDWEQVDEEEE